MSGKQKWSDHPDAVQRVLQDRKTRYGLAKHNARVTGAETGFVKPDESVTVALGQWRSMTKKRQKNFDKLKADDVAKGRQVGADNLTPSQRKVVQRRAGYRSLDADVPAYQLPPKGTDPKDVIAHARLAYWEGSPLGDNPNPTDAQKRRSRSAERFLKWVDVQTACMMASQNGNPAIMDRNALQWSQNGTSPDYPFLPVGGRYNRTQYQQVQDLLKLAQQNANNAAGAPAAQQAEIRRQNTQCALLAAMDKITAINGLKATQDIQVGKEPMNPRLTVSYFGEPARLLHKLINPYDSCAFVHARPSELSSLVPKIEFFIRDQEGYDVPVLFSDHVDSEKLVDLANVRAGGSLSDVLSATDQMGLNVGVKEFNWMFENKHEGDKTVKASLKLYFGSLSELVNQYYLRFLFTTGQPTTHLSVSQKDEATKGPTFSNNKTLRKKEMMNTLTSWEKTLKKGKKPLGNKTQVKGFEDETRKNDFRQLKVVCGWAAPEGERISSSDQELYSKDFLDSLPHMRKVLLLNMASYKLNFKDEGQVELNIEYYASIDTFYSKSTSDVLAGHALDSRSFAEKRILVARETKNTESFWGGTTKRKEKLLKTGYLAERILQGERKKLKMVNDPRSGEEIPAFKADYNGTLFEIEYLRMRLDYLREFESSNGKLIDELQGNLDEASVIFMEIQNSLRGQKYASFLEAMVAKRNLFVVGIRGRLDGDPTNAASTPVLDHKMPIANADSGSVQESIRLIVSADEKQVIETRTLDPGNAVKHAGYEVRPGTIPIFYMRLGDIVDTAIRNMGIDRPDVSVVLGSFVPSLANIPSPIAGTTLNNDYYSLADLPISFDYFGHWFMEHVVSKERQTYPLRHFLNDLMNGLVADVINFICPESPSRIFIDFTSVTTQTSFYNKTLFKQTPLITAQDLDQKVFRAKPRVNGPIHNNFVVYAKQLNPERRIGNRKMDEEEGIYHLILGADTGILKGITFAEKSMPHYRAMKIEATNQSPSEAAGALILPQDASCRLFGNSLFQNGQLVFINAELGLGRQAAETLKLGGYYRIYRVDNSISVGSYETVIECKYDDPRQMHTQRS